MGGRSKSSTSTSTSNEVDNRQFAIQDGMGGFAGGDQTFNVLDGGAIESAERTTGRALALVDSGQKSAFDFGQRSIEGNERVTRDALDFGGDALRSNENVTRTAMETLRRGGQDAFDFGRDSLSFGRDALDLGADSMRSNEIVTRDAIDAVRRSGADALDLVDRTTDRALASNSDATAQAFDFGRDSLDFGTETVRSLRDTTSDAFNFGLRLQDEMTGMTRGAFEQINNAFQGVQQLASNAVRGEAGEVSDTARTALYVAGGLGATVLAVVLFRGK